MLTCIATPDCEHGWQIKIIACILMSGPEQTITTWVLCWMTKFNLNTLDPTFSHFFSELYELALNTYQPHIGLRNYVEQCQMPSIGTIYLLTPHEMRRPQRPLLNCQSNFKGYMQHLMSHQRIVVYISGHQHLCTCPSTLFLNLSYKFCF